MLFCFLFFTFASRHPIPFSQHLIQTRIKNPAQRPMTRYQTQSGKINLLSSPEWTENVPIGNDGLASVRLTKGIAINARNAITETIQNFGFFRRHMKHFLEIHHFFITAPTLSIEHYSLYTTFVPVLSNANKFLCTEKTWVAVSSGTATHNTALISSLAVPWP